MSSSRLLFIAGVLVTLVMMPSFVASSETLGCEGFVRLSEAFRARGTADLTTVHVRLMRGSVNKFTTECSPAGYFFLPAYEPGEYSVEVSTDDGFSFESTSAKVTINADDKETSSVSFTVTGFSIAGEFTSPVTAAVQLLDKKTREAVATVNSDAQTGKFVFANVLPGSYVADARHEGWTFRAHSIDVDATGKVPATLNLKDKFEVTGYDVRGKIASEGKPMAGVYFAVYGKASKTVACGDDKLKRSDIAQISSTEKALSLSADEFVCAVKSGDDGEFLLSNVPAGEYTLVPHYALPDSATYDVSPARVSVTVKDNVVNVKDKFQVVGFSVSGTVVAENGKALAGVNVVATAKGSKTPVATVVTDAQGMYRLNGIRTGSVLSVEAKTEGGEYAFAPIRDVPVSPSAAELPAIRATGVRVSGRVSIKTVPAGVTPYPRRLTISDAEKKSTSTVNTDAQGNFRTYLPDGAYTVNFVQPIQNPIAISPEFIDIKVASAPVDDLLFQQEAYGYRGTVKYLQAVPKNSRVYLIPSSSSSHKAYEAAVTPKNGKDDDTVGVFEFEDVLVGSYKLSVVPAGASPASGALCFGDVSFDVKIAKKSEPATVEFSQMGYRLNIKSPVPIEDIVLTSEVDSSREMHQPYSNEPISLCVSTLGKWFAEPVDPFAKFEKEKYELYASVEESSLSSVTMNPSEYRLRGTVKAGKDVAKSVLSKVEVKATVSGVKGKKKADEKALTVETEISEDSNEMFFAAWMKVGQRAAITFSGPEDMLFYPPSLEFSMRSANDAATRLPLVSIRPEVVLRGRVDPATARVKVTVVDTEAENVAVASTETDEEGRYVVRRLRDDKKYRELFSRPGLSFEVQKARTNPSDELVMSAIKLSAVTVVVKDGKDGSPVSDVLVAISGGSIDQPYHMNGVTLPDGTLTTGELHPGEYYARPLLKEYSFVPASQTITVEHGQSPVVEFVGTRSAFSVFGRIVNLDQQPAEGVSIVATPKKTGLATEQAQTDKNGAYRIRGLVPNEEYTIHLDKSVAGLSAYPALRTITMDAQDMKEQDFVLISLANTSASRILGHITASDDALARMEVALSCNGTVVQVLPLARMKVFEFGGLKDGNYVVRMRPLTLTSKKQQKQLGAMHCVAKPEQASVSLSGVSVEEVQFSLSCSGSMPTEDGDEGKKVSYQRTSVWSLALLTVGIVLIAKYELVFQYLIALAEFVQDKITSRNQTPAKKNKKQHQQHRSNASSSSSSSSNKSSYQPDERELSFLPANLRKTLQ